MVITAEGVLCGWWCWYWRKFGGGRRATTPARAVWERRSRWRHEVNGSILQWLKLWANRWEKRGWGRHLESFIQRKERYFHRLHWHIRGDVSKMTQFPVYWCSVTHTTSSKPRELIFNGGRWYLRSYLRMLLQGGREDRRQRGENSQWRGVVLWPSLSGDPSEHRSPFQMDLGSRRPSKLLGQTWDTHGASLSFFDPVLGWKGGRRTQDGVSSPALEEDP